MEQNPLALKSFSEGAKKLVLDAKGPGEIKASKITESSDIEILNPELHIATLNEDAQFRTELRISRGKGYVPAEENKFPDQPIGTIPIDAIFSPVRKVNFSVTNARVGHRTDYDKLTLEVWTDGSVSPEDAVALAE